MTIYYCYVHFGVAVFYLVAMMVSCFRTVGFLKSSSFMVAVVALLILSGILAVLQL